MSAVMPTIGPQIKATSNERHRLTKQMNGEEGSTFLDALCEKIDDGLDAGAKKVLLTIYEGNLVGAYNAGRAMDNKDKQSYLQLDSTKDPDTVGCKQIGCKGIGSKLTRAKLCGPTGVETTTSMGADGMDVCRINMGALLDPNKTTDQCWTGESDYRPKWVVAEKDAKYDEGVTTEYRGIPSGYHNFDLSHVVIELMKTYHEYIKDGVEIKLIYDGDEYIIPHLVNEGNVTSTTYNVEEYKTIKGKRCGEPTWRFYENVPGSEQTILGPRGAGYGETKDFPRDQEPKKTKFTIMHPKVEGIITSELKKENERSYAFMNGIANMSDAITYDENGIVIRCGKNSLNIPVEENGNSVTDKANRTLELLFNGVHIKQDRRVLSSTDVDIYDQKHKASGDIYKQFLCKYGLASWNVPSDVSDIREERKKFVNIKKKPGLDKVFPHILRTHNKNIAKKINEHYNSLLTNEQKKQRKLEDKQEKQRKAAEKQRKADEKKVKDADKQRKVDEKKKDSGNQQGQTTTDNPTLPLDATEPRRLTGENPSDNIIAAATGGAQTTPSHNPSPRQSPAVTTFSASFTNPRSPTSSGIACSDGVGERVSYPVRAHIRTHTTPEDNVRVVNEFNEAFSANPGKLTVEEMNHLTTMTARLKNTDC